MRRRSTAFVAIGLLAFIGSACAEAKDTGFPSPSPTHEKSESPSPSPASSGPEKTDKVEVALGNVFKPAQISVAPGTKVTWTQTDTAPHTVTANDGSFESNKKTCNADSICMKQGDVFTYTFAKKGSYPYYCVIHGTPNNGMTGTVVVE